MSQREQIRRLRAEVKKLKSLLGQTQTANSARISNKILQVYRKRRPVVSYQPLSLKKTGTDNE